MKIQLFIISFMFLTLSFLTQIKAFTITIESDKSLKNIPILIKVEVDGIPRTIGPDNFQNISKNPFEMTMLQKGKVKITGKIGSIKIEKELSPYSAKILKIQPNGDSYIIK